MKKKTGVVTKCIFLIISLLCYSIIPLFAHLCDNVFRQADKLIVKPENYNLVVKDKTTFKIFLQNNMDRGIADISMVAESPAFDISIMPERMEIPQYHKVYFEVTLTPKKTAKTGNYPINFRLIGGEDKREFKSFTLNTGENKTSEPVKPKAQKAGIMQVKPLAKHPAIDGNLDEKCWQTAAIASNFSAEGGGKSAFATASIFSFDKNNLYLGLYCCAEDAQECTANDKIRVIIARDSSGYPQYSMTFFADGSAKMTKFLSSAKSIPIDSKMARWKTKQENGSYTVEASVPLVLMDAVYPISQEKWYVRIIRTKANGTPEKSYWSADSSGYNSENGFGEIMMVP